MKTISQILLSAGMALLFTACGNDKKEGATPVPAAEVQPGGIAYIVEDSLQANYQLCIDAREALDKRAAGYKNTVTQKEQTLQSLQKSIQTRMQNGQIATEAQYKQEMQKYQQQENAYVAYRQQIEQELAKEQADYARALQDSVDHFLAEYNKTKRCSLILYRAAILYTGTATDITAEVVAGLNKRYRKNK